MIDQECVCGHPESEHEAVLDSDGFPHDFEQFCMGSVDCQCKHFDLAHGGRVFWPAPSGMMGYDGDAPKRYSMPAGWSLPPGWLR